MKLVSNMGMVYRLTNKNYDRLLRAIADGEKDSFNLALNATFVGIIIANITNMTADDAKDLLEE